MLKGLADLKNLIYTSFKNPTLCFMFAIKTCLLKFALNGYISTIVEKCMILLTTLLVWQWTKFYLMLEFSIALARNKMNKSLGGN